MDEVNQVMASPKRYINNLTWTVFIVIVGIMMHYLLNRLLNMLDMEYKSKQKLKRSLDIFIRVLILTLVAIRWVNALNAFVLMVIGLSLFVMVLIRGILDNIIGWFIISKRDYFKIDDRIEIDGMIGTVIRRSVFHFEVAEIKHWLSTETYTGRVIKIPNNKIFSHDVSNYSQHDDFIWHEISYTISHDSNWRKTKEMMIQTMLYYHDQIVLPAINQEWYDKLKINIKPALTMNVTESGIALSVRYLVDYHQASNIKTLLHEELLDKLLADPDINFAVLEVRHVE